MVLRTILDRDDDPLPGMEIVNGIGAYNALADYKPGPPHGEAEERVAQELSRGSVGPCFVLSFDCEPQRVTRYEGGHKVFDGDGDATTIARHHGLSNLLPPPREEPRSFVFAEGAGIAEVAQALEVPVPGPGAKLHLEERSNGTLGWTEGQVLGARAAKLSRKLKARVHAILDAPGAFHVSVYENGTEAAAFEQPATDWSEGLRVDAILGGRNREEILRSVGAPEV